MLNISFSIICLTTLCIAALSGSRFFLCASIVAGSTAGLSYFFPSISIQYLDVFFAGFLTALVFLVRYISTRRKSLVNCVFTVTDKHIKTGKIRMGRKLWTLAINGEVMTGDRAIVTHQHQSTLTIAGESN